MSGDRVLVRKDRLAAGRRGPWLALVRGFARALGVLPRPAAALTVAGWMLFIWWLSSGPIDVRPPLPARGFFANLAHAPVFGMLAALVAAAAAPRPLPRSWPDPGWRARLVALATVAAWAVTDEWHQSYVEGRGSSPFDALTDVTGAACVLWIAAYAGGATASERGLRRRLALGSGACVAAALAATLADRVV
jgi:uncharacterized membrane protein YphA (DoxX/SURF4 family)